jgi:hypothetical protein
MGGPIGDQLAVYMASTMVLALTWVACWDLFKELSR